LKQFQNQCYGQKVAEEYDRETRRPLNRIDSVYPRHLDFFEANGWGAGAMYIEMAVDWSNLTFQAAPLEALTISDASEFAGALLASNRSLMFEEFLRDLEAMMSDSDLWDLNPQSSAMLQGLSGLENPFIDAC
jgi:hypothetical protein